jgi:hypothetical protein
MVPAWSFAHRLSCSAAILAAVRQKRHLSNLSKNPEPALCSGGHVYYSGVLKWAVPQGMWGILRVHGAEPGIAVAAATSEPASEA